MEPEVRVLGVGRKKMPREGDTSVDFSRSKDQGIRDCQCSNCQAKGACCEQSHGGQEPCGVCLEVAGCSWSVGWIGTRGKQD